MKRRFCSLALLAGIVFAAKKPDPIYPNTKTYPASCDAAWAHIVPVISKNALVPESSDRLGGFMRLRYTGGDIRGSLLAVSRELDKFTVKQGRPGGPITLMRVNGGTLTVSEAGGSCTVTVQMEYVGYKESFFGAAGTNGWMAFRSNGLLEGTILQNLGAELASHP